MIIGAQGTFLRAASGRTSFSRVSIFDPLAFVHTGFIHLTSSSLIRHFLRGSSSQGWVTLRARIRERGESGPVEVCGGGGGSAVQPHSMGGVGGGRGGTHAGTYTRMLHLPFSSVSRVGPLVWLIYCAFFPCEEPVELDSVGEFTEIEGQKRSSAWCRGFKWAQKSLIPVEMELNDTKGAQRETPT